MDALAAGLELMLVEAAGLADADALAGVLVVAAAPLAPVVLVPVVPELIPALEAPLVPLLAEDVPAAGEAALPETLSCCLMISTIVPLDVDEVVDAAEADGEEDPEDVVELADVDGAAEPVGVVVVVVVVVELAPLISRMPMKAMVRELDPTCTKLPVIGMPLELVPETLALLEEPEVTALPEAVVKPPFQEFWESTLE